MSLPEGARLGDHEIVALLGKGGMGEVYRARDTKLGREVAIKVLPGEVFEDAEREARFEREARLLASLNHPSVATLHGFEREEETSFLVMELVEGETLEERIARGALAVEEAVALFVQIAEGLEAAHEKGIVHRDLKPANLKVTAEGRVKILDFGLAKAIGEESGDGDLTHSPTLSARATAAGLLMGTAAYMSPEQAQGMPADRRSDVWAFGVCLYEALCGRRLFDGQNVSFVLASVLKDEPSWESLPPSVSPTLRRLLERCLARDPKRRLRDIGDVRLQLEGALAAPVAEIAPAAEGAAGRRALPWLVGGIAGALVAGVAVWMLRPAPPAPERRLARFTIVLPEGQRFFRTGRQAITISPDGSQIAYTADSRLYVRPIDQLEARAIQSAGIVSPGSPFFSPDGQWLGFYDESALWKVAIGGGAQVKLCDADNPWGAFWGADDSIYFGEGSEGVFRVPAGGGKPERVVVPQAEGESYQPAALLPGGRQLLFAVDPRGGTGDDRRIETQDLLSGHRRVLIEGGTAPRFVPAPESGSGGHLLYLHQGTMLAVPFDAARLEVTGGPVSLLENVASAIFTAGYQLEIAEDGTLIYMSAAASLLSRRLVWVDRAGRAEPLPVEAAAWAQPRISPEGNRILLTRGDLNRNEADLWIHDLGRATTTRITFDAAPDRSAVWAPDGARVAFSRDGRLFTTPANGTGAAMPVLGDVDASSKMPSSWSTDGKLLLYYEFGVGDGDSALGVVTLDGEPSARTLNWSASESHPVLSPDGRFLAYSSDESGSFQVYVRPFPATESGKWQVSSGGGVYPLWSRDGREIFFQVRNSGGGTFMIFAVDVETEPTFSHGSAHLLLEGPYAGGVLGRDYDVSPDGERLLMLQTADEQGTARSQELIVVESWFEELRRRVPLDP